MSKDLTFAEAQRHAFSYMSSQEIKGQKNPFYVPPAQITMPAMFIQELPLTVAEPKLTFDFSSNGPKASTILNNIIIGTNDAATIFGIQVLIGYGANRNTRQYYSYGLSVDDNVVYNGKAKMVFESNELITNIDMNSMRSENGTTQQQYDGAILINPLRSFTGRNSIVQFIIDMGDISGLAFTPNTFVSARLWNCKGASSATN